MAWWKRTPKQENKVQIMTIDDLVEDILNKKGENIDPDIRQAMADDMKKRLIDQINRAAIMQLSEEKADELTRLIDNPNFTNEDMTQFMVNSGVNLMEVTLDTMLKFRELYLGKGK